MSERLIQDHERTMHRDASAGLTASEKGFLALIATATVISSGAAAVSWMESHRVEESYDEAPIVETLTEAQLEEITIRLDTLEEAICDPNQGVVPFLILRGGQQPPFEADIQACLEWVEGGFK